MTNVALPWHATSSFLSGVVVKTKKSKIPYLPRKQWNWDSVIMDQNDAKEIFSKVKCKLGVFNNILKG